MGASPSRHRVRRLWTSALVRLRWPVLAAWIAIAVAVVTWLPPLTGGDSDLKGFASGNPAVETELRSFELFGFPLTGRTAIVQRDPDGLSAYAQAEAVLRAVALSQGAYDTSLLGALPVPNTLAAFPGSAESGTTVVTYLFNDPRTSFSAQRRAGERFAQQQLDDPDDAFVGVTGSVPARDAQAQLIASHLQLVEVVSVLAIALIVGLTFRSVVAPLLTLFTVGVAVTVTLGVGGYVGQLLGVAVPADLEPLIVALLLGVVTDYSILFLSGLRSRVTAGDDRLPGARRAAHELAPIVAVAGVTVAAGAGAMVVARSALFRGAGPALALTVVIGLVVALTLVPALMGIFGRWAFWPSRPTGGPSLERAAPTRLVRLVTRRRTAALVAAGCVAVLALAALPLTGLQLGLGFIQSLPDDEPVAVAAAAAQRGFAPGILSPTELLLEGDDVGTQRVALARLDDALSQQPGVAGVLGPGDLHLPRGVDVLTTGDDRAARYLVVLDSSPLGAEAIGHVRRLQRQLPVLLEQAGVTGATAALAGDTALSATVVRETTDDLVAITVAALAVNLLLLVLFLRALVAPLYLLASSVLVVGSALGLTVAVFQGLLHHDGLTFYVPLSAAVLLVSLGSDYNVFAVGHVWRLAERRPLRRALVLALPQSTAAITAAGTALAASFGLLALVPLAPFRELAFAMSVGILLDVFVVRSLLVPSLLTLVGRASGWPSSRLAHDEVAQPSRAGAGLVPAVADGLRPERAVLDGDVTGPVGAVVEHPVGTVHAAVRDDEVGARRRQVGSVVEQRQAVGDRDAHGDVERHGQQTMRGPRRGRALVVAAVVVVMAVATAQARRLHRAP